MNIKRLSSITDVIEERIHQISMGFNEEYDDRFSKGELANTAIAHIIQAKKLYKDYKEDELSLFLKNYPFSGLKNKSRYDLLKCAAALCVAEMERLVRNENEN